MKVQSRASVSPGRSAWVESPLFVPLALVGITLAMFGSVIFQPGDRVLSNIGTDVAGAFLYWRQFGFDELRRGHIALWNPHVFGGAPFMGEFQPALFYIPNWIYMVLPVTKAINCEIALHVLLMGLFVAVWAGRYRFHPLATLLASSTAMFGSAFFLHAYAGHLSLIDAAAWVPLILCAVDALADQPGYKWVFIGIFAGAMESLAGFPPLVFQTAVACALYGTIRLTRVSQPLASVLSIAIAAIGSLLIATVQLWAGLQVASESTRSGGVPFAFAASFSFPPENLTTLMVPGFFGNLTDFPYWGRSFLWEGSLFVGLTGLATAIFGATRKFPYQGSWVAMAAALVLLALGSHTPLYSLLYWHVPGFSLFRASTNFSIEAVVFVAMLAALGMDAVIRSEAGTLVAAMILLAGALMVGAGGELLRTGVSAWIDQAWNRWFSLMPAGGEIYSNFNYADSATADAARQFAGSHCLITAAILLVLAGIFFARRFDSKAAYGLAIFGIAEAFAFAHSTLVTFSVAAALPPSLHDFLAANPGDYRTLGLSNKAIALGANDLWGYDATILRRYAEFVSYSQGNPIGDYTNNDVNFTRISPMLRLLRLRFIFQPRGDSYQVIKTDGGLPHLVLVKNWKLVPGRDQILETLSAASFDPEKTVILETDPKPAPVAGGSPGTVHLVSNEPESLTIAADLSSPELLLITDTYSRYWRAVPLPGSSQTRYQVMPADYTLMAVPLEAGHHLVQLEYAPSGYTIGRWISLAALVAYLFLLVMFLRRRSSVDAIVPESEPSRRKLARSRAG